MNDDKAREKIICTGSKITLKQVKDIARVEYVTKQTIEQMSQTSVKTSVNYLKYERNHKSGGKGHGKHKGGKQ